MKAIIEGFYGFENLGDDYLLLSILNSLTKIKGKKIVYILGGGDLYHQIIELYDDIEFHFINKAKNSTFDKIKRKLVHYLKMRNADLYIYGGGGLLVKDEPRIYKSLLDRIIEYKKNGIKKIAIYGIDVCDIKDEESKEIWKQISNKADYINLRNKYSADKINLAIESDKATYAPDITFSLETKSEIEDTGSLFAKYGLEKEKYIVWALTMPWRIEELDDKHIKDRYDKHCDTVVNILNKYANSGYKNVFLPFNHLRDSVIIKDVTDRVQGDILVLDEYELKLDEKRLLFKNARATVSMKFHGVAFSMYYGVPVAAVAYAPKSVNILNENGLREYSTKFGIRKEQYFFEEFDLDEKDFERVCDLAIVNNDRQAFENMSEKLRELAKQNEGNLLKIIDQ